jgi:hypothetical protein
MKIQVTVLLILVNFCSYAQFDSPKRKVNIAPISNPTGQTSPTSSRAINYPSIFDKKDKLLEGVSLLEKTPEEEKSIMEKEQFVSQSQEYTDRMNKKTSDGMILQKYRVDSFLGEFRTPASVVKISCRDHEYPDGDRVRIWLNDRVIINTVYLGSEYQAIIMDLKEGINKIEIEALNQGDSGPNTAQFTIVDDKGSVITDNKWNLTTGVKAKLVIVRENTILRKE